VCVRDVRVFRVSVCNVCVCVSGVSVQTLINKQQTNQRTTQGLHRLARGKYYFKEAEKLAAALKTPFKWRLKLAPNVAHENAKMSAFALDLLL